MEQSIEAFDWGRIILNDLPAAFLLEVLLRTLIIFLVVLFALRMAGKRGVRELSVFELIIILTLGSAAGDVSFYEDVPVLPVMTVFIGIIGLYLLATQIMAHSEQAEQILEGTPLHFVDQGRFNYEVMEHKNLSQEELVMGLRVESIKSLGQIETAILETSGQMSIFRYSDAEARPGMPTLPRDRNILDKTEQQGYYACARCADTRSHPASSDYNCSNCGYDKCMKAVNEQGEIGPG